MSVGEARRKFTLWKLIIRYISSLNYFQCQTEEWGTHERKYLYKRAFLIENIFWKNGILNFAVQNHEFDNGESSDISSDVETYLTETTTEFDSISTHSLSVQSTRHLRSCRDIAWNLDFTQYGKWVLRTRATNRSTHKPRKEPQFLTGQTFQIERDTNLEY